MPPSIVTLGDLQERIRALEVHDFPGCTLSLTVSFDLSDSTWTATITIFDRGTGQGSIHKGLGLWISTAIKDAFNRLTTH